MHIIYKRNKLGKTLNSSYAENDWESFSVQKWKVKPSTVQTQFGWSNTTMGEWLSSEIGNLKRHLTGVGL